MNFGSTFFHQPILFILERTLSDVTISVGDSFDPANKHLFNPSTFTQCIHIPGQLPAGDNEIRCSQPVPGRYVSVYLNKVSYLVLCEFQVHGTPVTAGKGYRPNC